MEKNIIVPFLLYFSVFICFSEDYYDECLFEIELVKKKVMEEIEVRDKVFWDSYNSLTFLDNLDDFRKEVEIIKKELGNDIDDIITTAEFELSVLLEIEKLEISEENLIELKAFIEETNEYFKQKETRYLDEIRMWIGYYESVFRNNLYEKEIDILREIEDEKRRKAYEEMLKSEKQ